MNHLRSKWLLFGCGLLAVGVACFFILEGLSGNAQREPLTVRVKGAWHAKSWADSWAILSGELHPETGFRTDALRSLLKSSRGLTTTILWDPLDRIEVSRLADAPLPRGRNAPTTWPMFGGTPQRNMVNTVDRDIPIQWSVEEGKRDRIKWVADLGSVCYSTPVVADGKVFVGTNDKRPRDRATDVNCAVLMCFNEADGKLLWQTHHDDPDIPLFRKVKESGLCSSPVVEDGFHYYVTPGCVVVCARNADGKIVWSCDMMKQLNVAPFGDAFCFPLLFGCSPLLVGDHLLLFTGNGINDKGKVSSPEAPSFLALHKKTGKVVWQSNLPGDKIIEGHWSNPVVAVVKGKPQVIFAGGDAVLYSFDPADGTLIWKCNCNPERGKNPKRIDNYIVSTPVVVEDKLYLGMGIHPDHRPQQRLQASWFLCLDVTKSGDVSLKSYDAKDAANKNSALVWAFGGPIEPRPAKGNRYYFGSTVSTAAVNDGLVYIPEWDGYLHCLDAKTGQRQWEHDFETAIWGSAYCVDGKVYIGTEDGEVVIFAQGRAAKVLATVNMDKMIHSTPVVAGGVLYVATRSKLYAIR
jgi:outer membrane protein assembly factor BamB